MLPATISHTPLHDFSSIGVKALTSITAFSPGLRGGIAIFSDTKSPFFLLIKVPIGHGFFPLLIISQANLAMVPGITGI